MLPVANNLIGFFLLLASRSLVLQVFAAAASFVGEAECGATFYPLAVCFNKDAIHL